jgi:hypothetical protein
MVIMEDPRPLAKCFHYTNLRPPWVANSIGLGARQCDLTVGCVRFGANGRNLDKDTIVGMFLILHDLHNADDHDHESFRTGEIVAAAGNCYLIQFDRLALDLPPPPAELYTLEELCAVNCENCGQKRASLFKRRADMEQRVAWLIEPEKPEGQSDKVVHLKKPH